MNSAKLTCTTSTSVTMKMRKNSSTASISTHRFWRKACTITTVRAFPHKYARKPRGSPGLLFASHFPEQPATNDVAGCRCLVAVCSRWCAMLKSCIHVTYFTAGCAIMDGAPSLGSRSWFYCGAYAVPPVRSLAPVWQSIGSKTTRNHLRWRSESKKSVLWFGVCVL